MTPIERMAMKTVLQRLLKGSWDLVTRVIIRVTILITPIKVLITLSLNQLGLKRPTFCLALYVEWGGNGSFFL